MKPAIAVLSPLPDSLAAALTDAFMTYHVRRGDDVPPDVRSAVRGVVTSGSVGLGADDLERFPNAEIVACFGVGVDKIDVAAARARGLTVTNTPGVLTEDVADMAIGLLIAAVRRICAGDRFVRSGAWARERRPLATSLGGKTLGVLGLGRIGQAIARRAGACGMSIAYSGPRQKADVPYAYHPDPVALAGACDFMVIATPGGRDTHHLVGARVIEALGPDGVLVNVARGSVVDEPALADALRTGRLGAAALDVFADEPHVPAALLDLDNVVLSPHQGSATVEARDAMGRLVLENLLAHFAGRQPPTPVG